MPDDFRGIKFGTKITNIPNLIVQSANRYKKKCRVDNENLQMAGAKLDRISYIFYKDRLSEVWIFFTGRENFETLLSALNSQFGMSLQTKTSVLGTTQGIIGTRQRNTG